MSKKLWVRVSFTMVEHTEVDSGHRTYDARRRSNILNISCPKDVSGYSQLSPSTWVIHSKVRAGRTEESRGKKMGLGPPHHSLQLLSPFSSSALSSQNGWRCHSLPLHHYLPLHLTCAPILLLFLYALWLSCLLLTVDRGFEHKFVMSFMKTKKSK